MTVEELIWQLSNLPGDLTVFVAGWCGDGAADVEKAERVHAALNSNDYCGPHDFHDPEDSYDVRKHKDFVIAEGVLIR